MGKMFITRDSYGRAVTQLALDVLRSYVDHDLKDKQKCWKL